MTSIRTMFTQEKPKTPPKKKGWAKVKNFEKLEPTLRNLNIKFDSRLVDKIMKSDHGCKFSFYDADFYFYNCKIF